MIIQEAALKQMDQRVKELEARSRSCSKPPTANRAAAASGRPVRRRQPQYAKPA